MHLSFQPSFGTSVLGAVLCEVYSADFSKNSELVASGGEDFLGSVAKLLALSKGGNGWIPAWGRMSPCSTDVALLFGLCLALRHNCISLQDRVIRVWDVDKKAVAVLENTGQQLLQTAGDAHDLSRLRGSRGQGQVPSGRVGALDHSPSITEGSLFVSATCHVDKSRHRQ